jgi:hypothetical protein
MLADYGLRTCSWFFAKSFVGFVPFMFVENFTRIICVPLENDVSYLFDRTFDD